MKVPWWRWGSEIVRYEQWGAPPFLILIHYLCRHCVASRLVPSHLVCMSTLNVVKITRAGHPDNQFYLFYAPEQRKCHRLCRTDCLPAASVIGISLPIFLIIIKEENYVVFRSGVVVVLDVSVYYRVLKPILHYYRTSWIEKKKTIGINKNNGGKKSKRKEGKMREEFERVNERSGREGDKTEEKRGRVKFCVACACLVLRSLCLPNCLFICLSNNSCHCYYSSIML